MTMPDPIQLGWPLPGTESLLPAAPVLLALGTGLLLMLPLPRLYRAGLAIGSTLLMLLISAAMVAQTDSGAVLSHTMGAWAAPFGIVLVADRLSAWMSLLTGASLLLSVLYAAAVPDPVREKYHLFALLHLLAAGVQLSFLTGDLFNLFVAFEIMLVASYALAVLGSTREQLRESFRYIVMNLVASALLVATCGMIYGLLGTLNMAHLAQRSMELGPNNYVTAFTTLLLIVFASKSAQFPVGFWLPGTYPAVPVAVGAFFGAILTKVGIYALMRTFGTMFTEEPELVRSALLILGSATMLFGALGLVSQREWRRILAFAVVTSVGYMAFGLGIGTPAAFSATLFYLTVSVLVTSAMFLLAGVAEKATGTGYITVRGMLERQPLWAAAFMFGALTIAGLPPTAGFIAKFALVQAAVVAPSPLVWVGVVSALLSSLVILYAMLNIWRGFFWGKAARDSTPQRVPLHQQGAMLLGMLGVVALALGAGPLNAFTGRAAAQMADPQQYIRGVLGDQPVRIPPLPTPGKPVHGDDYPSSTQTEEAHP